MTQARAARCVDPVRLLGRRGVGLWVNLYTLRSADDCGVGDFSHLATLIRFAAELGLDFIGLNPLHQIENTRENHSPYFPVSRLWRNPLYIDLDALPERGALPRGWKNRFARLRTRARVDYDGVYDAKLALLRVAHAAFVRDHFAKRTARGRAYEAFLDRSGIELLDHALALVASGDDKSAARPPHDDASAQRFIETNIEALDFHTWMQFETARQLDCLQRDAARRGVRLGLYHDLAIGAAPDSSEVFANPSLYARGVSLGAPPDGYSHSGQVWNLVPFAPNALARSRAEPYAKLVRANLAGGGMLRIDHVIGLVRQYWIPRGKGKDGRAGRFVKFPADALFRAVARASRAANAPIVGEDLGIIPAALPALMRRFGLLSTRFVLFERDPSGAFRAPSTYPAQALATIANHDVVPLAGWLAGVDLPIRVRLGLMDRAELRAAKRARRAEVAEFIRAMREHGALDRDDDPIAASARFLARTPCALAALSLDDLAGETTPVNVPTATPATYPCWSRRMAKTLAQLTKDRRLRRIVRDAVRARSGTPGHPLGQRGADLAE